MTEYICYVCGSTQHRIIDVIHQKPKGETDYGIDGSQYKRVVTQCMECRVYTNQHNMLSPEIYEGYYNAQIDLGTIKSRYDRVMGLSPEESDNRQRVARIIDFLTTNHLSLREARVLDIGSGTCVFLGALKEFIPNCACIDPDPRAIEHAIEYVGISEAHCGSLDDYKSTQLFDLITFNKVLEHVQNPVTLLTKAKSFLKENGFLYVELPEGDRIAEQKMVATRQEFFVEHYTIYNELSYEELAQKAKLLCLEKKVITEPSSKHTIYGFLKKAVNGS